MRRAALVLFLLLFSAAAMADSLTMISGENKKGRIIGQTDSQILFREESGQVVTIPRAAVASVDADPSSNVIQKNSAGFYSAAPKKEEKKITSPASPEKTVPATGADPSLGEGMQPLRDMVRKIPWIKKMMDDFEDNLKREANSTNEMTKKLLGEQT